MQLNPLHRADSVIELPCPCVCVCVCVSVWAIGCSFFRPLIGPEVTRSVPDLLLVLPPPTLRSESLTQPWITIKSCIESPGVFYRENWFMNL